jgi:hypothetical protein
MFGIGQEGRYRCEFGDFFRTTPQVLQTRNLYAEIANALHGGALRQTSMALLARSLQVVPMGGVGAVESNDDSSATVQLRATRSTVRDRIWAFKLQASNDLLATKTLNRRRECARSAVSLFIL